MRKSIVSVLALVTILASQSHALTPGIGWGYSTGYTVMAGLTWGYGGIWDFKNGWIGWWDPPANMISGQVTFAYDPSLIIIHPETSGFVGQFSDDPSFLPPVVSDGNTPWPDTRTTFPGPRPGMVWNLDVGADTVTLSFDLGANPITLASDDHVNFFGLTFETKTPVAGWTIETTSTGQFRELGSPSDQSQTFGVCSTGGTRYSCGAQTTLGLTAVMTPEPSTMAISCIPLIGLAIVIWRRRAGGLGACRSAV